MNGYLTPLELILRNTKMGFVTPDNNVVRLGPEYGRVVPSLCLISVSVVSAFFLLVI